MSDPFAAYMDAQKRITEIISRDGEASQAEWLRLETAYRAYEERYWPKPSLVISERATFQRGSGADQSFARAS